MQFKLNKYIKEFQILLSLSKPCPSSLPGNQTMDEKTFHVNFSTLGDGF